MPRVRKKSYIERANEISIFDVLRDFFQIDLPRTGTPYASYCPFGFEHSDGGIEKKFRTYPDSNSGNCFVMHGRLTPVKLIALRKEISWTKAARLLLEHYDLLHDEKPYPERWEALEEARRKEEGVTVGETSDLVVALQTSLRSHPAFSDAQYDAEYITLQETLLARLDSIVSDEFATEERIREWYVEAKNQLTEALDAREGK